MTEREAYIAFNLTENIGFAGVSRLVSQFGSAVSAWEAYPKKKSRAGDRDVDLAAELALAKRYGVDIVTPADEAYPAMLADAPSRPLALYVKGDVAALSKSSVSIVGTRRATQYGKDQAYRFARDLAASGWCIVSGLALGIDAEAHRGALDAGGATVGVLGSGLDRFYPEENRELAREIVKKGGAVVSEFPFGRSPDTQTFPQRNHVVAAISAGVLAIEAPVKSGTLITAGFAADIGRVVMALPGRVDSRSSMGCLNLIRDGARLVRFPADVAEELSELFVASAASARTRLPLPPPSKQEPPRPQVEPPRPSPSLSIEEALVMRHVDNEGISLDRLAEVTGLGMASVNAAAMTLRLKGRLRFLPGNRVATPRE